jgi:hypothetical protein
VIGDGTALPAVGREAGFDRGDRHEVSELLGLTLILAVAYVSDERLHAPQVLVAQPLGERADGVGDVPRSLGVR